MKQPPTVKEIRTLADLTPDPANARAHTSRNIGMIADSLQEVGFARSIVIDEGGVILAGNGVAEAAGQVGMEAVRVVEADGDELIVVRRANLTPAQKTRLALFDNRATDLSSFDPAVLATLDPPLLEGLWRPEELAELLATIPPDVVPGAGGDEFDATPAEGPTRCQLGDVWAIGPHRLLVGDSTNATDVDRLLGGVKPLLMVTDPPYGVGYDPEWRNDAAEKGLIAFAARREGNVTNDDRVDWSEAWALFPGNVVYCWHADRHASQVQVTLEQVGFEVRSQIIWAKPRFVISRGHYHWQHEPCWYAVRKGATAEWVGDHSQTTLWEIPMRDDTQNSDHGAQKPLGCMQRPMQNHGQPGSAVYDPFLGSGTTLIAAHRTGRVCYGLELEPKYADVILRRAEAEGIAPITRRNTIAVNDGA